MCPFRGCDFTYGKKKKFFVSMKILLFVLYRLKKFYIIQSFPTVLRSDMPRQFPHSAWSPFFLKRTVRLGFTRSAGRLSVVQKVVKILKRQFFKVGPPYTSVSGRISSGPGLFSSFVLLIAFSSSRERKKENIYKIFKTAQRIVEYQVQHDLDYQNVH